MELNSFDDLKSGKKGTNFNIYHYDAQLAIAFQSDCENFLFKFKDRQNCSFESFAELWRENNFLAIFKGQENVLMLQAFIDNCFFIAKKFLFSSDVYIQAGALFILYGLYYKQPIKEWVKVRLIQSECDKLNEIVAIHKANNSLDLVYIYSKMRLDGAFQYCALLQPLGLEPRFLRRYDLSSEDISIKNCKDGVLHKFKNFVEGDSELERFIDTDEEYQKLSQKFKGKLFVFPSKIGEDLQKSFSEIFHVNLQQEEKDPLKVTKNKAVLNINAVYRGERKVLTAFDLDTPSTSYK